MLFAKLKSGPYRLYRHSDQSGDSGPVLLSFRLDDNNEIEKKPNGEIHVGFNIECGSITARSYSNQDYWLTTKVTKILEANDTSVTFETNNSTYTAKCVHDK